MWCCSRGAWTRAFRVVHCFALVLTAELALAAAAWSSAKEIIPGRFIVKSNPGARAVAFAAQSRAPRVEKELGGGFLAAGVPDGALSAQAAEDPYAYCADLVQSGVVSYCEPDTEVHAFGVPNDSDFSKLWGMSASQGIDGERAWDKVTGSSDVVVAVVDTGADYTHPDLAQNIWTNPAEVANGFDDDGNGYVDDIHGINVINHGGDPMDDNGHGTHVAGTIGAAGNNGLGVAGVNWTVRIMPLKFLNASGSGSVSSAIEALQYMLVMKAKGVNIRVSNNSWGGGSYSRALEEVINQANSAGIAFVAAAGNESNDNDANPSYPAGYDVANVVSVAAVDKNHNLASFSNFGASQVDIAAPGVGILSTVPGGRYASYSGTSMATPHVTGALALLAASEPELGANEIIERLYLAGVPVAGLAGMVRTGRMLNVARMVFNETTPGAVTTPAPDCPYSVAATSDAPDFSADKGEVLIDNSDEYDYRGVNLPFPFPFEGGLVNRAVVSPNGVLYFGGAPSGMDYENGPRAPLNSIAALHADIVSTVRYRADSSSATFYWHGHRYANAGAGDVDVRLTLSADGLIREWISFSSPSIEQLVQQASTVGLSGKTQASSVIYAYNNAAVQNGAAVMYAPLCSTSAPVMGPVSVSGLSLWGVGSEGERLSTVTPGGMFRIRVRTAATGASAAAELSFVVGRVECRVAPTQVQLVPGQQLRFKGRLPAALSHYRQFSVQLQSMSAARRVTKASISRRANRKNLSDAQVDALCAKLSRSVRQVK